MKYEGPHPDEGLPVNEEPLLPKELDIAAEFLFGLEEGRSHVQESDFTPVQWQAIRNAKIRLVDEAFESIKQDIIDRRR